MELVFIHGWGFDARFWDALSVLLPQYRQRRIDLGFYGQPSTEFLPGENCVLVGHSLGFVHGLRQKQDWSGWIAINSFPRFVRTPSQAGCVSVAELREIKMNLTADTTKALKGFYGMLGAPPPEGSPDIERLRAGLDELRDIDISSVSPLDMPGLVLATRDDPLVPVETSEMLGSLGRETGLSWHQSGGHILPLSDPLWCSKAIEGFVQAHFG